MIATGIVAVTVVAPLLRLIVLVVTMLNMRANILTMRTTDGDMTANMIAAAMMRLHGLPGTASVHVDLIPDTCAQITHSSLSAFCIPDYVSDSCPLCHRVHFR